MAWKNLSCYSLLPLAKNSCWPKSKTTHLYLTKQWHLFSLFVRGQKKINKLFVYIPYSKQNSNGNIKIHNMFCLSRSIKCICLANCSLKLYFFEIWLIVSTWIYAVVKKSFFLNIRSLVLLIIFKMKIVQKLSSSLVLKYKWLIYWILIKVLVSIFYYG